MLIRDDAPETTAFSTRGWFSLPKARYRIPAGTSVDLPLRIRVPGNTPAGTYLGAALLRVIPPASTGGGSQVQAVPETGPLLFIAVEGGDPPEAAMKRFDVPGFVKRGPLRPDLVIENLGDEFFTFEGTIKLSGPGTDRTVEIDRQYVVPGEPRSIQTSASDKGEAGAPVLGSKDLEIGRYTVTTRLRIEPVGTTLVASRTVWVIPTWARILAVSLVLVFLVCVWFLVRWLSHRRELNRYVREEFAADEPRSPASATVANPDDDVDVGDGEIEPDEDADESWDEDEASNEDLSDEERSEDDPSDEDDVR